MIYSGKEAIEKYGTRYNLSKALKNKEIFRLEHGIYSDKDLVNPMIIASKKYSSAIITMDSAFYYYDLTDVIPKKTFIATNRNSNIIHDSNIVQIRIPKEKLNQGKEVVLIDGEKVKMYNRERLLVELIRKRNQIPFDYYKELISNYRKIVDDLDMYKIEEYLSLYKNESNIADVLLREVF
ncbi:MAG TPA: nucleotidyltransferase [Candidatus Onthousia faecipullorum]|uniref:Nucleotidyltransferase n=1 Tax=Candidatus Onthousia faecipullorum TaxID=2840887 RepID=A0A9D1KBX9_9FIRM|nr:nucleotidyltransferase [Candidatus Onthousia faecipullorum]